MPVSARTDWNHRIIGSLAVASLALSAGAFASSRGPRPAPSSNAPAGSSSSCDDLAREVQLLRARVDAIPPPAPAIDSSLVARIAALEARRSTLPVALPSVATPLAPTGAPRYVALDVSQAGLRVQQLPDGSLSVQNTDPAQTGKTFVIQAQRADGTKESLVVTAPPPSAR